MPADFITRVELHDVEHDSKVYSDLHEAMAEKGFFRVIQATNTGRWFSLPHATYARHVGLTGLIDVAQVNNLAYAVAETVWHDVGCITSSAPSAMKGLKEIST